MIHPSLCIPPPPNVLAFFWLECPASCPECLSLAGQRQGRRSQVDLDGRDFTRAGLFHD